MQQARGRTPSAESAGNVYGRPPRLYVPERSPRAADGDPGPSNASARGRATRSTAPRSRPIGVREAEAWHASKFEDRHRGSKYTSADLADLFATVTSNPRIRVASLFNLLRDRTGGAGTPIKAFADGLPTSNLIAANLGEYTAPASTWQHLLAKIKMSDLGHLYISEPNMSGMTPTQKVDLLAALRANRNKPGYLQAVVSPGQVRAIRSANPWWSPPLGDAWIATQRRKLRSLGNQ